MFFTTYLPSHGSIRRWIVIVCVHQWLKWGRLAENKKQQYTALGIISSVLMHCSYLHVNPSHTIISMHILDTVPYNYLRC